mmetsp:Transcript_25152/g.30973  ORF Transcript_25152/g.30973 Transcript_25152/m.30973 type:complete len:88 (-) Transcript_25152:921-1184(-)
MCIPSRVVQHQLLQLKPHQRNQMERLPNNHAAPHHREYLAQGYNGGRQSDIYITDRKNMVKKMQVYPIFAMLAIICSSSSYLKIESN